MALPSPSTVAVVNGQRVSTESADGKAGQVRMQTLQREKAEQLRTRQQTLEGLRLQLAQATEPAVKAQLQQQETLQRQDFERATAQAQIELQNFQRQVAAEVQMRVRQALDEILKGRPITIVLQQESGVLWAAPGLDLTNEVIALMNKKASADQGAPAK